MLLFARNANVRPEKALEAATWAVEIGKHVSNATGLEVHTWATLYGGPITNVAWTARVESQAAMGVVTDTLAADAAYQEQLPGASELFEGPTEDLLAEILLAAGPVGPVGSYASVVSAQCASGKIAEAMTWGAEMTNHLAGVTGLPTMMTRGLYGPFATVAWITLADDLASLDKAGEAISADESYIGRLDAGVPLFQTGSGVTRLSRRLD